MRLVKGQAAHHVGGDVAAVAEFMDGGGLAFGSLPAPSPRFLVGVVVVARREVEWFDDARMFVALNELEAPDDVEWHVFRISNGYSHPAARLVVHILDLSGTGDFLCQLKVLFGLNFKGHAIELGLCTGTDDV